MAATIEAPSSVQGPITRFPADDLRHAKRFITTHSKDGRGVFLPDDSGDHHKVMVQGKGVATIIYSTQGAQVDLNDEKDIEFAKKNEVC
jgi:hypothetical protein